MRDQPMITMNESDLFEITFRAAVPNCSYYRHESWPAGSYKMFRHEHTMPSSLKGFTFWNKPVDQAELEKRNSDYPTPNYCRGCGFIKSQCQCIDPMMFP